MKYNFNGFTENGNNAINLAIETAEIFGHTYVGSEHLLIGLLKTDGIAKTILEQNGCKLIDIEKLLEDEKDPILLCYEESSDFCHRHIVYDNLCYLLNTLRRHRFSNLPCCLQLVSI